MSGLITPLDSFSVAIVRAVGRGQPLTRDELAAAADVSRQTLSKRLPALVGHFIEEFTPAASAAAGRPPAVFRLSARAGQVLAADVGHRLIRVAKADANGQLTDRREKAFDVDSSPRAALLEVFQMWESLVDGNWRTVRGAGVGIPAPTTDGRAAASLTTSWSSIDVRDILRRLFPEDSAFIPAIVVANDANLAARAECIAGAAQGHRNVLFVKASHGIGAALIFRGELYTGATGCAGEFGHALSAPTSLLALDAVTERELNSKPLDYFECPRCKRRGCLETVASGWAIPRLLAERYPREFGDRSAGPQISEVIRNIKESPLAHKRCMEAINIAGHHLGAAIAGLVNVLDPDLVVVGGILSDAGEAFLGPIQQEVGLHAVVTEQPTQVVAATDREAGVLRGAVATVMRESVPLSITGQAG